MSTIALAYLPVGFSKQPPWDEWIEGYTNYLKAAGRPRTTVRLRINQLRHLADGLKLTPGDVTTTDLIEWFAAQNWATETRRSNRSAARGFYRWAHRQGLIDTDPAAELPVVSQQRPLPHPVPDEAVAHAKAIGDARVLLMMRLAALAGLRRAEIAAIHTDDLIASPDGYSLLVHGKGGRDRVVPLSDELGAAVAAGPASHTPGASHTGWLFPGDDAGHLSAQWVGELCAATLPGKWTLHGLRHRFATRAYAGSHDIRAVQELLGHSSPAITQRYVQVDAGALRAAMMAAAPVARAGAAIGLGVALLMLCAADEDCGPSVASPRVVAAAHWCTG